MRRLGFPLAATIIAWVLFGICVYVLLTAPELRSLIEHGVTSGDWRAENYRQLGLFLGVVTFFLFLIAAFNTYFLLGNVRVAIKVANVIQIEEVDEKRKRQAEIHDVLASLSDDEREALRELLESEDDSEALRLHR